MVKLQPLFHATREAATVMRLKAALRDGTRAAGTRLVRQAEAAGNHLDVPVARNLGVGELARQTLAQISKDRLRVYAGHLAYRSLFALFPSVLALLWLLQVLEAPRLVGVLLDLIGTAMPEAIANLARDQVTAAPADQARGAFTWWAALSVLVALWALSGIFRAAMDGLNAMYAVEESRPTWKRYLLSLALGLTVAVLLIGALGLIVGGTALAQAASEHTGLGVAGRWATQIAIWPVVLGFVLGATALTYYFAPDVTQRFRWISSGSVVAAVLWLLFTVLYSLYLGHFTGYNHLYGALAGVVLLMAYVYVSAFILLLGAEINQVIESTHPAGKDKGQRSAG